jgi:hypothetical protein
MIPLRYPLNPVAIDTRTMQRQLRPSLAPDHGCHAALPSFVPEGSGVVVAGAMGA